LVGCGKSERRRTHEVPPPDEDLPEGLARGLEAEDAAGEEAELARAQEGLLDVEADHLLLEMLGSAVPGAAAPRPRRGRGVSPLTRKRVILDQLPRA
jgi:hypothetical protein